MGAGPHAWRLSAGERGGLAGHHAGAIRLRPARGPGAVPPPNHAARPAGQVLRLAGPAMGAPGSLESQDPLCAPKLAHGLPHGGSSWGPGPGSAPTSRRSAALGAVPSEWLWRVWGRRLLLVSSPPHVPHGRAQAAARAPTDPWEGRCPPGVRRRFLWRTEGPLQGSRVTQSPWHLPPARGVRSRGWPVSLHFVHGSGAGSVCRGGRAGRPLTSHRHVSDH